MSRLPAARRRRFRRASARDVPHLEICRVRHVTNATMDDTRSTNSNIFLKKWRLRVSIAIGCVGSIAYRCAPFVRPSLRTPVCRRTTTTTNESIASTTQTKANVSTHSDLRIERTRKRRGDASKVPLRARALRLPRARAIADTLNDNDLICEHFRKQTRNQTQQR